MVGRTVCWQMKTVAGSVTFGIIIVARLPSEVVSEVISYDACVVKIEYGHEVNLLSKR